VATCKSSTKLYNSGKYSQAVSKAVAKLRSSPGHSESQNTLVKSYPLAVNTAKRDITNALQSNSVTKYDVVINRYEQLNRMAREIYTCPKASQLIPAPEEFHEELRETKEIAAAHYYDLGVRALNERTLKESKTAYQYFVKSNSYVKGYRDVISKMDEAMFAATLHVVVEAPKLPERYQFSADFFYSNLVTEMNKTHEKKYVVFYTPEAAQTSGMTKPHQYIVLDFLEFSIGNVRESKNTQEVKRDNVPVTVEVNGRQTTGTTTVTANFTAFRRDVISGGKLHVRIIDAASNRVTEQRAFEGSYTWVSEWASYTGDDRALSDAQKKMAAQQATLPPPNQDLFIEFTKPIYTQVLTYVRGVYRKYQ
jgi:hypothetical protein